MVIDFIELPNAERCYAGPLVPSTTADDLQALAAVMG